MNQELALRVLGDLMNWTDAQATEEFTWLRLMAKFKYDSYEDFVAGARFIESLVRWLRQFEATDRPLAYAFVRSRLLFVGAPEMLRLVEVLYHSDIEPVLRAAAADEVGVHPWDVWHDAKATESVQRLRRQSLFMGLSDGARMDMFRRANNDWISNEQVVVATQIDTAKWADLVRELRASLDSEGAGFRSIWLIDDFSGSGLTFCRRRGSGWSGKLPKFIDSLRQQLANDAASVEAGWTLHVHHYIGTQQASDAVRQRCAEYLDETDSDKPAKIEVTFGLTLSADIRIPQAGDEDLATMVERYYNPSIETSATKVGGDSVMWGFNSCGLPLVLHHNTPNNSLALLWAESDRPGPHNMRALFRRRQRHSG